MVLQFNDLREVRVCPNAFAKAHDRGHSYYDKAIRNLKRGDKESGLFKKHCALSHETAMKMFKKGGHFKLNLSATEFTQLTLRNTCDALTTAAWLEKYFKYSGKIYF